jgi:Ca2+-binding EF-hand superfamily protein
MLLNPMKTNKIRSRMLVCGLSLFVLPIAFANDPDKKLAKMDTNGDGQISRMEHSANAQRMFTSMDTNGDGAVTAAEMNAVKEEKDGYEMSATEKIKEIDNNGDGNVTAMEHATAADAKFDKMDTNRDGSLSKDELQAGHKMKKKDKRS